MLGAAVSDGSFIPPPTTHRSLCSVIMTELGDYLKLPQGNPPSRDDTIIIVIPPLIPDNDESAATAAPSSKEEEI